MAHTHSSRGRGNAPVLVLALSGITVAVMQTLLAPLLPKLPVLLHAPASDTTWTITATLLAGAVAPPVMGRLGDMYGKRPMMFVSLALLVVGSLTSAFTSSLVPMVVGRALQGGAMGVIPLGIGIMRDMVPMERLGSAMALMSSSLGIGAALGLPASAAVAQHTDWHVLFLASAGLGAAAFVLTAIYVPAAPVRTPGRFDFPGAIGLSAALVCLLLAVSKGGDWGWGSATTVGMFAAAAFILVVWSFVELRTRQPLVNIRTTARSPLALINIVSVLVGFVMYAQSMVLPQLLQLPRATGYGLGQPLLAAGLVMAPGGLVMMVVSPLSARISATRGPKLSLLLGALIATAGYAVGLALMGGVWQVVLAAIVMSTGIAFAYSALPALIMGSVPPFESAAANGFNSLMRAVGTSTSSAVAGAVLAATSRSFRGVAVPTLEGFRIVFLIAGAVGVVAVVASALIFPSRRPRPAPVSTPPVDSTHSRRRMTSRSRAD
ncbi:MFS transporter [Planotetraspora sp. GP83]|uniref:MFS transporter n=1 Tax=Planotetraspora sp. GP83 TaxID=3156264 RepID=UPI0035147FAD